MTEDIVITGLGIMSPIGCDAPSFWTSLCDGRSGAKPVTSMDTGELTRHVACQITEPIDDSISGGRASKLAVLAARQALSDAGFDESLPSEARAKVVIGTTMGETEFIEEPLFEDDACADCSWALCGSSTVHSVSENGGDKLVHGSALVGEG